MLLFIYCLLLLPFLCFYVLGPSFVMKDFASFLVLQSAHRRSNGRLLCFYCLLGVMQLFLFLPLPRGIMGWSVVCDCGNSFPGHTILALSVQTRIES